MQAISIKMDGDAAWPELKDRKVIELPHEHLQAAFLDNGTVEGNPTMIFRSDDGDTTYVLELTGRQLQAIAAAFTGKYGQL